MRTYSIFFVLAVLVVSACVPRVQLQEVETELARTRIDLHQTRDRLNAEQTRTSALESELEEYTSRMRALQASLEQAEAAREREIAALENALADAKRRGSVQAAELASQLDRARQERQTQIALLESELEAARLEAQRKAEELARINATYEGLMSGLKKEIEAGQVTITQLRGKLTVNLIDQILFDSGSAELNQDGQKVLDTVSEILRDVRDRRISVEGHTDNVPIARAARDRFPSNWELSTARSSTVVRYLTEKGVPADRLSATGFAYHRPIADNDTPESRRLNRRIEIVLLPELAADDEPTEAAAD
jgi:chemotaxis protein MotB